MKYGLVLAGGGVRGAFHIGVWKALRKMGIEIEAVTGTSIGAINGALIAQGEYETALKMWRGISIGDIISLPPEMEGEKNIFTLKNMAGMAKGMYENEGLDMAPLEDILRGIIDENKLRNSEVDFGIAAFSLTDKKGIYKFKNEIPEGQLIDYIMASASILTAKKVGNEKLSDGGMYDNMPAAMLLEKGIKDIITVDVKGIGINRGFQGAGKNIIHISSKTPQTGIMEFDRGGIMRSIDEGYLAAMKAFGRAAGEMYYFNTEDYMKARERYSAEIISGIEKAAEIFDISSLEIYTFEGLKDMVIDEYVKQSHRGAFDIKDSDDALLIKLVAAIENGRTDFMKDKLSVLGAVYDAASAILYFKK